MKLKEFISHVVTRIWRYIRLQDWWLEWRIMQFLERTILKLSNSRDSILRASILLAALLISYFGVQYFDLAEIKASDFGEALIGTGLMIGGTIAILFTLSLFLRQTTSQWTASFYYDRYHYGHTERSVYFVVVLTTLAFLFGGLLLKVEEGGLPHQVVPWMIYVSVLMLAVVFVLMDILYKAIRSKSNPRALAEFLGKEISKSLNSISEEAKFIAKLVRINDVTLTQEQALAVSYNTDLPEARLRRIDDQIEELTELIHKLAKKEEIKSVNYSLHVLAGVVSRYLQLRKDSSLAFLHHEALLAWVSDSDARISKILENIRVLGEAFIADGRYYNALELVDIYKELGIASSEVKFVNAGFPQQENPIFEKISGYFGFFMKEAIKKSQEDVVLRSSAALNAMSAIAAKKHWSIQLETIRHHRNNLIIYSLTQRKFAIFPALMNDELEMITQVFGSKLPSPMQVIDSILEDFAEFTCVHAVGDRGFTTLVAGPFERMENIIRRLVSTVKHSSTSAEMKAYLCDHLPLFFDELYMPLRQTLEKIECNPSLFNRVIRFLEFVNHVLLELIEMPEFNPHVVELKRRLGWYVHLPSFFLGKCIDTADRTHAPEEAADMLTTTAINALEAGHAEIAEDCLDSIANIADKYLEKRKFSYSQDVRIMTNTAYVGSLALSKGLLRVSNKSKQVIEAYQQKSQRLNAAYIEEQSRRGSAVPLSFPEIKASIENWRNGFRHEQLNSVRLGSSPEDLMLEKINLQDIDNFIRNVWSDTDSNTESA